MNWITVSYAKSLSFKVLNVPSKLPASKFDPSQCPVQLRRIPRGYQVICTAAIDWRSMSSLATERLSMAPPGTARLRRQLMQYCPGTWD